MGIIIIYTLLLFVLTRILKEVIFIGLSLDGISASIKEEVGQELFDQVREIHGVSEEKFLYDIKKTASAKIANITFAILLPITVIVLYCINF